MGGSSFSAFLRVPVMESQGLEHVLSGSIKIWSIGNLKKKKKSSK